MSSGLYMTVTMKMKVILAHSVGYFDTDSTTSKHNIPTRKEIYKYSAQFIPLITKKNFHFSLLKGITAFKR